MATKVLKRVPKDEHRCVLPFWWGRRKLGINKGGVILLGCGHTWTFWLDSRGDGRYTPGSNGRTKPISAHPWPWTSGSNG